MKIHRLLALSGLLLSTALPFTAHANAADRATNACVQAFVDAYLPKNRQIQVRNLPSASAAPDARTNRFTIDLKARLSRSGTELVSARCIASATGQVINIDNVTTL